MGIKAALFAIYEGEPGYFGEAPVSDMAQSFELALRLPLRAYGRGVAAISISGPHLG